MNEKLKQVESMLKCVLFKRNYFLIFIFTTLATFFILYKLLLATIAENSLRTFVMMSGYNYTYFTLLSFVFISVLSGVYLSVAIFRFNLVKKSRKGNSGTIAGFFGLIAGVLGAGCPTCGSVIFALVGTPLALMYLPFRGLELRILSIIILVISIYILSRSLIKCEASEKFK